MMLNLTFYETPLPHPRLHSAGRMHQIRQRTQTNTRPYFTCGGLSSEEMKTVTWHTGTPKTAGWYWVKTNLGEVFKCPCGRTLGSDLVWVWPSMNIVAYTYKYPFSE